MILPNVIGNEHFPFVGYASFLKPRSAANAAPLQVATPRGQIVNTFAQEDVITIKQMREVDERTRLQDGQKPFHGHVHTAGEI